MHGTTWLPGSIEFFTGNYTKQYNLTCKWCMDLGYTQKTERIVSFKFPPKSGVLKLMAKCLRTAEFSAAFFFLILDSSSQNATSRIPWSLFFIPQ